VLTVVVDVVLVVCVADVVDVVDGDVDVENVVDVDVKESCFKDNCTVLEVKVTLSAIRYVFP